MEVFQRALDAPWAWAGVLAAVYVGFDVVVGRHAVLRQGVCGVYEWVGRRIKWIVSLPTFFALVFSRGPSTLVFVIGSILNVFCAKVLKRVINEQRPSTTRKRDPGMPSSHATSLCFFGAYLSLILNRPAGRVLVYVSAWVIAAHRISAGHHTVAQILVGGVLGTVNGLLWYRHGASLVVPALKQVGIGSDAAVWRLSVALGFLGGMVVSTGKRRRIQRYLWQLFFDADPTSYPGFDDANDDNIARIVKSGYDTIADRYARLAEEDADSMRNRQIDAALERLGKRPRRCLDLGCGAGVPTAQRLCKAGHRVVGVDISPRQIALARKRVPRGKFVCANMGVGADKKLAWEDKSAQFDAVFAFFSVFHLPREQHPILFSRVARWLKPGGFFVFCCGPKPRAEHIKGNFLGVKMVWSEWGPERNRELLENAGLRVESVEERVVREGNQVDKAGQRFFWIVASKSDVATR